jgi:hypothetical protein
VDDLLRQGDTWLDQVLADHIREDFAKLRESGPDISEWRSETELIRQRRDEDIEGSVDSASREAKFPRSIREHRRRIIRRWSGSHGLSEALYRRLDNKEKGGLNYTIQLIRDIGDTLNISGTGICQSLEKAADEFEELADILRKGFYTRALSNLEKAATNKFWSKPSIEKCTNFLNQAEEALRYYLNYRLRALACREASALLREDIIVMLGKPSALDEDSDTGATGIIAEFERGRKAVREALQELEDEIRVLDDTANKDTPFRISIPGGSLGEVSEVHRQQLEEWGEDVLADYGGSRELFEQLRNEDTRLRILSHLRRKAHENMQEYEKKLPTVQEALLNMSLALRQKLFEDVFKKAMPWVNADLGKDNGWSGEMITCFIAVEDISDFMKEFKPEIIPRLPAGLTKALYEVSSSERGRMVVYTEFSGMPLNVLIALHDDWRTAYEENITGQHKLPMHNHLKSERFQRPTAMSVEELRSLHDNLKLFLKAIGLGVLRRRPEPDGRYEINVSREHMSDWQALGPEQQIYLTGFPKNKKQLVQQQVETVEQKMTLRQILLASALFQYIADETYSMTTITRQDKSEDYVGGIAHHASLALSKEYREKFDTSSGRREIDKKTDELLADLAQSINDWAQAIPDSTKDTSPMEANINKAKNKVWVDFRRINDDHIDRYAGIATQTISSSKSETENRKKCSTPTP